ncbi:MAG: hypothetical protein LUE10_07330 [Alistipes sp.]|nr:hypothetical protein [Alistipes sp.]
MKIGATIRYGLYALILGWFAFPFTMSGSRAVAQAPSGGDSIRGIDARDPERRESRENAPVVEARFVPDSIGIGDIFQLQIDVTRDMMQIVETAELEESNIDKYFEIISSSGPDTIRHEGRRITTRKTYTLQTFEDGVLSLGWFPALYLDKNVIDTIWSVDSLVLMVGTFEIDTLKQTIHDIRGIRKAPVKFGEFGGYTLWGLLILALVATGIWYYIIMRRRNLTMLGKPKVVDPPHVAAIKALEALHNQKLWQNNRHKQYYTGITDILRSYLEKRYFIQAMEMTSDEILGSLKGREIPEKSYGELTGILRTADLVKFAKYQPDAETNENIYTHAYYFVEETKPFEIEKPDTGEGPAI